MDIVVHFDLSMSLVVTGPPTIPSYKLKPVLHLFEDPLEAATIEGRIDNSAFTGLDETATIVVVAESNREEYTRVVVEKSDTDPTAFNIFWIVPNQSYTVKIDLDQNGATDCIQVAAEGDLEEGEIFLLNDGNPIEAGSGICS